MSGPSRGGKSRWAEHLLRSRSKVTYIATSEDRPQDADWQKRMQQHRDRRPGHWRLIEPGITLAASIHGEERNQSLLIDALGGFTAAQLELNDAQWEQASKELIDSLCTRTTPTVVVIEETGWGVVPATAIGGLFRDRQGWLAQRLEQHAIQSWLVVQGRALNLSQLGILVP